MRKQGEGLRPPLPCRVKVSYTGRLAADGTRFETGVHEVPLGEGAVIKGLEKGLVTMRKGEVAVFTCRADYAYGAAGRPPSVPPGATLRYEVGAALFAP